MIIMSEGCSAPVSSEEGFPENKGRPLFCAISVRKLKVFYIITFGAYQFYWFYKHWVLLMQCSENTRISPIFRSLFSVFFVRGLLQRVDGRLAGKKSVLWYPTSLTVFYCAFYIIYILYNIQPWLVLEEIRIGILFYVVSFILNLVVLVIIQKAINMSRCCSDDMAEHEVWTPDAPERLFRFVGVVCWVVLLFITLVVVQ